METISYILAICTKIYTKLLKYMVSANVLFVVSYETFQGKLQQSLLTDIILQFIFDRDLIA